MIPVPAPDRPLSTRRAPRLVTAIRAGVGVVALATAGCADPAMLAIDGVWNFNESFADDVHHIACTGQGVMTLAQSTEPAGGVAPGRPGSALTGTAGIDNVCTSLDGPFSYFGDVVISAGTLTADRPAEVSWDAAVNEAGCRYEGTVTGDGTFGTEMSGTLACTLVDAGVTFQFIGTWVARNWRSAWCAAQRTAPGCAVVTGATR